MEEDKTTNDQATAEVIGDWQTQNLFFQGEPSKEQTLETWCGHERENDAGFARR